VTFDVLAARWVDDAELDDGMFPLPAAESRFVVEPLDGPAPQFTRATAVSSKIETADATRGLVECRRIVADVAITDQRVVISCEKYDKGGGWVGTPAAMVAANAVSAIRAARRTRGKVLVGHVRYQWLHTVAFLSLRGLIKVENVRLGIADGTCDPERPVALDLELPKHVSSAKVARHIVDRATTFWLAQDGVPEEHREAFWELSESEPVPRRSGGSEWMTYRFPFYLPALPETALVARARGRLTGGQPL